MLAAGWGGTGSVIAEELSCYSFKMPSPDAKYSIESVDSVREKPDKIEEEISDQDKFIDELIYYFSNPMEKAIPLPTLKTLKSMGLDLELVRNLSDLIDGENNTKDVITAFLYVLLNKPFEFVMPRQVKRIILKKYKESSQNQDLYRSVKNILINANKIA